MTDPNMAGGPVSTEPIEVRLTVGGYEIHLHDVADAKQGSTPLHDALNAELVEMCRLATYPEQAASKVGLRPDEAVAYLDARIGVVRGLIAQVSKPVDASTSGPGEPDEVGGRPCRK